MAVTLTSAVRSNLNTLQSTADMMSKVQDKLATGKKVNSALDNPNSFFTAKGLENRASDLTNLLDDMGQAVQTLKAADKGIQAVSKLVDSAKAKANQALTTADANERDQYANEYNELMTQIDDLVGDSSYKGKNLIGGASSANDLKVSFNEDASSKLDISSVDLTSSGLGLSAVAGGAGTGTIDLAGTADETDTLATFGFDAGSTVTIRNGSGGVVAELDADTATVEDLTDALNEISGVKAKFNATDDSIEIESSVNLTVESSGENADTTVEGSSGFNSDDAINAVIDDLKAAQDTLRSQASTFGTNLSIVETRQDFTTAMVNTLTEGAGKLTLADTNEEGANLLALQTQQSLATTSLSLAAQASQNVLRLF